MCYCIHRPSYTPLNNLKSIFFRSLHILMVSWFFYPKKQCDIAKRTRAFDSVQFSTPRRLVMVGFTYKIFLRWVIRHWICKEKWATGHLDQVIRQVKNYILPIITYFQWFFWFFYTRKQGDITIRYSAFDSFHSSTSRQLVMVGFTCNILLRSVNFLKLPDNAPFSNSIKTTSSKVSEPDCTLPLYHFV